MSTQKIDESLFDIRVVDRNIARGKVTREQYEAYLGSLEDLTEQSTDMDTRFVHKLPDEDEDKSESSRRKRR